MNGIQPSERFAILGRLGHGIAGAIVNDDMVLLLFFRKSTTGVDEGLDGFCGSAEATDHELLAPEAVVRRVGQGGFEAVHRARNEEGAAPVLEPVVVPVQEVLDRGLGVLPGRTGLQVSRNDFGSGGVEAYALRLDDVFKNPAADAPIEGISCGNGNRREEPAFDPGGALLPGLMHIPTQCGCDSGDCGDGTEGSDVEMVDSVEEDFHQVGEARRAQCLESGRSAGVEGLRHAGLQEEV